MILKLKRWIIGALMVALLPVSAVQAYTEGPEYLTQAGSRTCTLCSATMMLRSCLYIYENDLWQQITEEDVAASAWTSDGMYWNWSYAIEETTLSVAQQSCSGITAEDLETQLQLHPEGIVLYCGGSAPHAVFLTDCTEGAFYCADPANGYSGSRIPLDKSLLGARHGSQEGILSMVCAYWYIADHNVEDPGYLANCREFSLNCRVRVRWDGYAMSLPCTERREMGSERVHPIQSGQMYDVLKLILNDAGQYWYLLSDGSYIHVKDTNPIEMDFTQKTQNNAT